MTPLELKQWKVTHRENLKALRRIEGQTKGIQRMVDEGRYCVDIIIQIHAAIHALYSVSEKIFAKHIDNCVSDALRSRSENGRKRKIDEVMDVMHRIHKLT